METFEKLGWQLVVLITAVAFLLIFKKPVAGLIGRIKEFRPAKDSVIVFGEGLSDKPKGSLMVPPQLGAADRRAMAEANWGNTGNLFWLGHDLMWTMQIVLRGAGREKTLYGLRQAWHHMASVGLGDSAPGRRMKGLLDEISRSGYSLGSREKRNDFAVKIDEILDEIGVLAEGNQPDFTPGDSSTAAQRAREG